MSNLLAFGMPGAPEWIFILVIVLLFFGAAKLPELAKGLGLAIKEFKKASKEVSDELDGKKDDKPSGDRKNNGGDPPSKG